MKNILKKYLMFFEEENFYYLTEQNEFSKIIKSLLRKNGIHNDRMNFNEFRYYLFISLTNNRDIIISIIENDLFEICSVVANGILKEFNKDNYSIKKFENSRIGDNDKINKISSNKHINEVKDEFNIEKYIKSFTEVYRVAIKSYYSNRLAKNLIPKIYRVKRSTFYNKLKEVKKKILEDK